MHAGNGIIFNQASINVAQVSEVFDGTQLLAVSADADVNDAAAAGVFKMQMSNEATPLNWTDVANTSKTIAGVSHLLIPRTEVCARWLRFLTTNNHNSSR